jgi:hypothetical protein
MITRTDLNRTDLDGFGAFSMSMSDGEARN